MTAVDATSAAATFHDLGWALAFALLSAMFVWAPAYLDLGGRWRTASLLSATASGVLAFGLILAAMTNRHWSAFELVAGAGVGMVGAVLFAMERSGAVPHRFVRATRIGVLISLTIAGAWVAITLGSALSEAATLEDNAGPSLARITANVTAITSAVAGLASAVVSLRRLARPARD